MAQDFLWGDIQGRKKRAGTLYYPLAGLSMQGSRGGTPREGRCTCVSLEARITEFIRNGCHHRRSDCYDQRSVTPSSGLPKSSGFRPRPVSIGDTGQQCF
jgi:hypothetical protein